MSYDYIKAKELKTNIITMTPSQIEKIKNFRLSLLEYSKKTVQQFYNDANKAKFKI